MWTSLRVKTPVNPSLIGAPTILWVLPQGALPGSYSKDPKISPLASRRGGGIDIL